MPDPKPETILKAAAGDLAAFEVIYREYFKFVSHVALRIVNRVEDAEDLTQEVFMNIYHNLKQFRSESSLKTWLYRIAVNTAINFAKRNSKYREIPEHVEFVSTENTAAEAEQKINQELNERTISTLLAALNPDQRACIVLRSVEGLSYEEIAQTLEIPVNTVRSRIKRARETMMSLRKEVTHYEM